MVRIRLLFMVLLLIFMLSSPVSALVNYDEGQRMVKGIQLLQDVNDPSAFYYIPQFPRLATNAEGGFEILCLKYTDASGGASGGLFHALVEFTLPPDVVEDLQKELEKKVGGARIVGPVPLMQAVKDGEEGMGSFAIVSAVLSDQKEGGFTRSLITSGKAPLTPGSKAVVAAILNPQGATLLWDSFTGATSDVSVAINAYYEAAVKGYNAKVTAEVSTVYRHFSRVINIQQGYTKRQLRKIVDDLQRTGDLKVEVMDRSKGLNIDAKAMESLLGVVTDKLVELMFNHETGWAKEPQREVAVEANQIQGRQQRGWFSRVFGGAQDTKYFTDDQYVLKKREDIQRNAFSVTLAQSSTIKVPVNTAGNLGGLYQALGNDTRYFRIVNLEDPAFESRTVHFQIDGGYLDAFQQTLNVVSVNFRKRYANQPAMTRALHFTHEDIKAGKTIQSVAFARLGIAGSEWMEYEYQLRWGLRDGPVLPVPARETEWINTRDSVVPLVPPFEKRVLEVDADRAPFKEQGYATAVLDMATRLAGNKKRLESVKLRANDANTTSKISIYHDRGAPVAYQLTWYSPKATVKQDLKLLEGDYLFIVPPPIPADN